MAHIHSHRGLMVARPGPIDTNDDEDKNLSLILATIPMQKGCCFFSQGLVGGGDKKGLEEREEER